MAYAVTATSAQGLARVAGLESLATGDRRCVQVAPDGNRVETTLDPDGTETLAVPDGAVTRTQKGPDPRFGMLAPVAAETVVHLPSGLAATNRAKRTLALAAHLPFGTAALTNVHLLNGQSFVSVYEADTRTLTETTPSNRFTRVQLDAAGRPVREETPGFDPVLKAYDAAGRPTTLTLGTGPGARVTRYAYDAQGNLAATVDPLDRTNQFTYDAAGRRIGKQRPDGAGIGFVYDAQGNLRPNGDQDASIYSGMGSFK